MLNKSTDNEYFGNNFLSSFNYQVYKKSVNQWWTDYLLTVSCVFTGVYKNYLYIFGGYNGTEDEHYNDVYRFNLGSCY